MVYIYKKTVGSKRYYYLRASLRKGGKILVKDIAYLGSSIEEMQKALQRLPKYNDQIRKAYKTIHNFIESNRYREKIQALKLKKDLILGEKLLEIEACKLHYSTVFKKSPESTKKEILKNFVIEFAYNTASIEGNTIKLNEARNLLQEGLTPKNKTIREIYDIQNTEKVFLRLLETTEELNHQLIQSLHAQLMVNIDARIGYRIQDVRVIKSNFDATPAPYVKTDIALLLDWYKQNRHALHPVVLATIFHHKFEKIHPFMDGNGRTGRMLLNYILLRQGYPPLVIHTRERLWYLRALHHADKVPITKVIQEDYQSLINFAADELIHTYWNLFL